MGINMNEAFPSKWLRADDIERETVVIIHDVTMESIGDDERKPVIWFEGYDKGMVLNKTNANNCQGLYGPDTDMWLGKPMTLATAMVDFQGKSTRALRLYPPPRRPSQQAAQTSHQRPLTSNAQRGGYAEQSGGNPQDDSMARREFAPVDDIDF